MSVYDLTGQPLDAAWNTPGVSLTGVYNADAGYIPVGEATPVPIDYTNYAQRHLFGLRGGDYDACAVYGGYIFQLEANNKLHILDLEAGVLISGDIPIASGHGDAVCFTREKYAETDEFPLMYITTGASASQARVNVCRVTKTSAELIRSYVFPLEHTGYYGDHAYDEDNGIMYIVGYSEQNFTTDDGGANKTVVSAWDMTDLTDNGDGTYTPAFISAYERPFIYVSQDVKFHDGYIWIASGYWDSYVSCVFAMRPDTGAIEHTIMLDDAEEIEGICWIYDRRENRYFLLTSQQTHGEPYYYAAYSRFDFADPAELPDAYQRLPYIVGSGTASNVNTGIAGNNNDLLFDFSFLRTAHTAYGGVCGNYVSETTNGWRLIATSGNTGFYTSQNTRANNSRTFSFGTSYVGKRMYVRLSQPRTAIAMEGVKGWQNTDVKANGTANNNNIDVGNVNTGNGSASSTMLTKWYFFRIFDGSVMVRDYVPCKRLSDGKIGFYDTVNDTFNPSTGAAEFTEEA